MKSINPTITVQNLEGPDFAVTVTHNFGGMESATFTVLVPKTSKELGDLQRIAWERVMELLQTVSNHLR